MTGFSIDPLARAAMEAAGYPILITSPDLDEPGPIIWLANRAMADLTGYAIDELVGKSPRLLQGPDTDRRLLAALRRHLETGRRFSGEAVNYRKDGSHYLVDWQIDPVLVAGGIGAWIAIQRDVTERSQTRLRLLENEERLNAIFSDATIGLSEISPKGQFLRVNQEVCRILGRSEEDLLGLNVKDVTYEDDLKRSLLLLTDVMRTGESRRLDKRYVRPDGRVVWANSSIIQLPESHGSRGNLLVVTTDLTERRAGEDAIRSSEERLHVLVAELQHRTRNLMGIVHSLTNKTAEASRDLPDFLLRYKDRLEALSRVQKLLSRLNDHDRVTFDELLAVQFAALDGEASQVDYDGPPGVRLRSSNVQTLALALHELATNALKYGALSQPDAKLKVAWSLAPDDTGTTKLRIDWQESGVAMAGQGAVPIRRGQGLDLIEKALPYQLDAETELRFLADGVQCRIVLPVSQN